MPTMQPRREFLQQLMIGGTTTVAASKLWNFNLRESKNQETVDFDRLRADYMLDPKVIYLNHASIGTIPKSNHSAHVEYLELCETNPWLHMWGGVWDKPREEVRAAAAELVRCRSSEIAINHNTTELFNILALGLPLKPSDEVLFSSLCHAGASIPFSHHSKNHGYSVRKFEFPIDRIPTIGPDDVVEVYSQQIRPETRVLIIPHIDNTVGLRYPVRRIAAMARDKGVEFVAVDGAQAVGMIAVDISKMNVDAYATSPHKWLQAPKGLGLSFISQSLQDQLAPMWVTWGQDRWKGTVRRFEDYGTRNLAELLTLGDAIEHYLKIPQSVRTERLKSLWQYTKDRVADSDGVSWASPQNWDLGASLYAIGLDAESSLLVAPKLFSQHQIVVRPFKTESLNTLRVSPNVFNSNSEIDQLIDIIAS